MKPSEHLQAAWNLIQQPGKWAKGDWALDSEGKSVHTDSKEATCWCSLGALYKVREDAYSPVVTDKYLTRAAAELTAGAKKPAELNDEANSVQELAPMWERAIQLAKEDEK